MIKQIINKNRSKVDRIFLFTVIVLSLYGTAAIFSAGYAYADFRYSNAYYFIQRQSIWLILGILVMLFSTRLDTAILKKLTPLAYFVTLLLLVLTLAIGFVGNGAKRWISIGPLTIQPSEIAKLTMVMMLAKYFSDFEEKCTLRDNKNVFFYGTLYPTVIMIIPILMIMLQKHLSCIIILGTIGILLIISAGAGLKYIGAAAGIGGAGVCFIAFFTDYTKDRITVWLDPEKYKLTGGWQTLQGLMAIGSGGFFGKGYGKGELKYCYVSEPANDMIFAIVCEELGFLGAFLMLMLFGILIFNGFSIALATNNTYDRLLALGIIMKVAVQTLLNIAVVTNTIPNTGISLPFFSYGGSSLLMLFFEMGIILSISAKGKKRAKEV